MAYDIVVVGASWGGLLAVRDVLAGLPRGFRTPIVIAQHRSADSQRDAFRDLLADYAPGPVCEAGDKDEIRPGTVYLAPPDYHLLIEPGGTLALSTEERVQFARPSIDVLFQSAGEAYGSGVVGVVLTGANEDGAAGLAAVARHGGATIIQDPETAERPEMPAAALAAVPDALVRPIGAISTALVELCGEKAPSA